MRRVVAPAALRGWLLLQGCGGSEPAAPAADQPSGGASASSNSPPVIDEVTLVGSRCGPFDQALAALEQGHVQVQPLIAGRFDLSRGLDALAHAQTKGILKVLLDVS